MKSALRLISQCIVLLLTVVIMTTVNTSSIPGIQNQSKDGLIKSSNTPMSATSDDDADKQGLRNSASNPSEEIHDDIVLHDQKNVKPFGYTLFIPVDPLPMIGHSIPPLQRPPRA